MNSKRIQDESHFWSSPEEFLRARALADGVHGVRLSSGRVLQLLLQGQPLTSFKDRCLLTFFTAAVDRTERRTPPFFSGVGIAGRLRTPLLALADPALSLSDSIPLGWYTGVVGDGFQAELATLLSAISERAGRPLLFTGGSAGGYASLLFAERLREQAAAFVWNPQTSILDYYPGPVDEYLASVHGLDIDRRADPNWRDSVQQRLKTVQLKLNGPESVSRSRTLVYLQNGSDGHREKHFKPWIAADPWPFTATGPDSGVYSSDERHAVAVAEFSSGHSAPPPEVIEEVLRGLLGGSATPREICIGLTSRFTGIR